MPIKTKIFSIFTVLTTVFFIAAQCDAAQPPQAAQSSQQTQTQVEESATVEEEHQEDKENKDEAHDEEDEHNEEGDQDQAVELSAVNLADGQKLKVLATTNIVGDLVRNVGGDMIELTTMLPIGADPHTFSPAPQDAAAVADAHVVFINGLHLEVFLEELIENAGGEAVVVTLSTNVETRQFEDMDEHSPEADDDHEAEPDHHYEGADPHIWMTPANTVVMVDNIEHALSQLDPANAETYKANADAYEAQLEELDAWVKNQIDSIPAENRELVTDHDAFGYYTDRYGLEVVGTVLPANTTDAEPSAQEMVELQETIQKFGAKAIFVGTTVNPRLAAQIAEDTGIKLIPLYTGSLGEAGSGAETYLDLIRYNTRAIVAGLK